MALSIDKSLSSQLASSINLEGLHDLLEVARIDAHNARVIRRREEDK